MTVKCPVCHMQVPSDRMSLVYQGMHFAFCSEQCRERFRATPHLYIGVPGQKAAKQEGQEVIKQRCFHLGHALTEDEARTLVDKINELMGVRQVVIENSEVTIRYDLLELTAEQIERKMIETGVRLGGGWVDRMRRALVRYTEDCQTANMEVSDRGHRHHHH